MEGIIRRNREPWYDLDGNPIHAHGGWILKHGDYYYWYGEDRRENYYISCYRSSDLVEWEFRKHILTTDSPTTSIRVVTQIMLENSKGNKVNLERPKVIYNKKTKKFVLWAHFENGNDYSEAAVAIATADKPDDVFTYHGHFRPYGYMSRDCTLFVDKEDTAYFISAARDNADLHVYRLSEDYLNVDKLVHKLWQGEYREAPAVFEKDGEYVMITSGCSGWKPNQAKYSVAKNIEDSWTDLKKIGDQTTFDSQASFILKEDNTILYFGDYWQGDGDAYFTSGYAVYPLKKDDGEWKLLNYDKVHFSQDEVEFY